MAYAERTIVPVSKSKAEIEDLVMRYGATRFQSGWDEASGIAVISFECEGWRVRFTLSLPARGEYATVKQYDQETRRLWRALALVIKAKLESIASQIESFEEAFLAQIVLPGGETVANWIAPRLQASYQSNTLPPLLPIYLPAPKP